MGEESEVVISRKLDGVVTARVTRVVASGRTRAADDAVAKVARRLSTVGRVSARRLGTASRDREARQLLLKDMSAILAKDPELKQAVTKWANAQIARTGRQRRGREAVGIGGGGGSLPSGRARSTGGGGGRLGRAELPKASRARGTGGGGGRL